VKKFDWQVSKEEIIGMMQQKVLTFFYILITLKVIIEVMTGLSEQNSNSST
jgi:hypothetical protein